MVWRYACGLDIILALIFVTFSTLWTDSMKVYRQWVPCECNSSYNFILIFLKLCTCFLHGLEMCMWFGYNLALIFVTFFTLWTLSFSDLRFYESGYLVSATPYTVSILSSCSFAHLFFSMVWRCACGMDLILQLIFVTLLTLSFFNFSQVRHQLHRSLIYIFWRGTMNSKIWKRYQNQPNFFKMLQNTLNLEFYNKN